MDKFNVAIEPLWVFLHRGHIVRRAVLAIAVWMTLDAYVWVKEYGSTSDPNEWLVVAILGVPSALLSSAIAFYNKGRAAQPGGKGE